MPITCLKIKILIKALPLSLIRVKIHANIKSNKIGPAEQRTNGALTLSCS